MLENFSSASSAERLLYSPQKALDMALELGAAPQRLFRVLYPIWRVQVEGRQRTSQDFEELEWFIERGIQEATLNSVPTLAHFFGLEERFVNKVTNFLQGIGHLKNEQGQLALTELGRASVQQRVRLQEQKTGAALYFEGVGSRPLKREHYSIPLYPEPSKDRTFQTFYLFSHRWRKEALQELKSRVDREAYNLPDEVTEIRALDQELVYLPLYIIQRRPGPPENLPLFLAFSRIPGMRDEVLEQALNHEPLIQVPLRQANQDDLEDAVKQALNQRGLAQEQWYLQTKGAWGPQVMIAAEVLRRGRGKNGETQRGLALGEIGKYLLARDWCVWLTCDDPEVRQQAALEQLLEWLQHVTATPTAEALHQRLAVIPKRLKIKPIPVATLLKAATQRGLGRALERLDAMVVETKQNKSVFLK
jgi:hypothetical protein